MARTFRLDQLRIASPCPMRWEDLTPVGDTEADRVRHCGACGLNVYNVASLSSGEVGDLLGSREPGQRVCAVLRRRADGTVITRDCPIGLRAARRAAARVVARVAAALGFAATTAALAQRHAENRCDDALLGDVQPDTDRLIDEPPFRRLARLVRTLGQPQTTPCQTAGMIAYPGLLLDNPPTGDGSPFESTGSSTASGEAD